MRFSSSWTQLSLSVVVFLAALIGCGFWYGVLSAKSAAVAGLESQIEAEAQTAERIASARAALTQIAGDEASVQAYFVSDATVVSFIDDLQSKGSALGATVTVLSVAAANENAHPALQLSVGIQGPFDAVMRTVGAIEYAPYDVVMGNATVGKLDTGKWSANLTFTVGSAPVNLTGISTTTAPTPAASSAPTAATVKGKITPTPAH